MVDFLSAVLVSFITIFVIMDPFPSVLPFLTLTEKCSDRDQRICATKAVVLAGTIGLLFLFIGPTLLGYLHITLNDFKVAGGIVLALLGLETVLGFSLSSGHEKSDTVEDVAILIATPLLTGPGLISSLIILSEENGLFPVLAAFAIALVLSWITLFYSVHLRKIVGDRIIHVASKIIGILLLALGVAYIKTGLLG